MNTRLFAPCRLAMLLVCAAAALPVQAGVPLPPPVVQPPAVVTTFGTTTDNLQPLTRSGHEIYQRFREGLSDPGCPVDASPRWREHFAHVPRDLAGKPDRLLPLFGYVLDSLHEYGMPSEYALIPFVESGYRPSALSTRGPAGMWQFITSTARNHRVAIAPGYDGRFSPVESTSAAVRYLRTLHGMFAGDWRLAAMGYNAGEYRILGALRSAGQQARNAEPDKLAVPGITRAYVRKLQALSCLLVEAGEHPQWLEAIDHEVPVLTTARLPAGTRSLDAWAVHNGYDPELIRHFNPAFANGEVTSANRSRRLLVPARPEHAVAALRSDSAQIAQDVPAQPGAVGPGQPDAPTTARAPGGNRTHTVVSGDSVWRIARRYGVTRSRLMQHNGLSSASVLRPGMILLIDGPAPTPEGGSVAH